MIRWVAVWCVCAATAWTALRPGAPQTAEQMWHAAELDKGERWQDPVWVDVARTCERVAPWQDGWTTCRQRIRTIAEGRRASLAHDRGGVRRKAPITDGR